MPRTHVKRLARWLEAIIPVMVRKDGRDRSCKAMGHLAWLTCWWFQVNERFYLKRWKVHRSTLHTCTNTHTHAGGDTHVGLNAALLLYLNPVTSQECVEDWGKCPKDEEEDRLLRKTEFRHVFSGEKACWDSVAKMTGQRGGCDDETDQAW